MNPDGQGRPEDPPNLKGTVMARSGQITNVELDALD
jgi:hypothetical protein